jgi:hypothetical protein
MIIPKGETKLSIRSIHFDGATQLENQKRGSDVVKIHYQVLVKRFNESSGQLDWTVVSDHNAIFNGEFADQELKEIIPYFKRVAVKILNEAHHDQSKNLEEAIDQINTIENAK